MAQFITDVGIRLLPHHLFVPSKCPSEAMSEVSKVIVDALDEYFPFKLSNKVKKDLPWITPAIRGLMKNRDSSLLQLRSDPQSSILRERYIAAKKLLRSQLIAAKLEYSSMFKLSTMKGWNRLRENLVDPRDCSEPTHLDREFSFNNGLISEEMNREFTETAHTVRHAPATDFERLGVSSLSFKFRCVSHNEVEMEVRRLNPNKAWVPMVYHLLL